ncbi:MAG: malonyl-CoA decarboxylase [Hyphomicrobiales bacterium]|nr:malonyl-CoA decarboxylase [Hyphomicrobiales bacterium]
MSALAAKLLTGRGEASGIALAQTILDGYRALAPAQRRVWLAETARRLAPDPERLAEAARAYLAEPGEAQSAALASCAEPGRQELLRRLNRAPGATLALVRMREDLLSIADDGGAIAAFDRDFLHLFSSWFNGGFLVLRRIDWNSPANVLEKIIRYEAVHEIRGWDDLRRRLEPADRRLYAFFHPALGDEPLIFVEVALGAEIPSAIACLLAPRRSPETPEAATVATFYSISNTQRGLAGVSFGNFLIKRVVEDLRRDLPRLQTFVTLSPAPGFAAWLKRERESFDAATRERLADLDLPGWADDPTRADATSRVLAPLAARYFLRERDGRGRVLDPVARFHLGNGASLERIDPLGDRSPAGLAQSHGLMVNYLYDLDRIEDNHEAYANRREVVASAAVRKLLANSLQPVAAAKPSHPT